MCGQGPGIPPERRVVGRLKQHPVTQQLSQRRGRAAPGVGHLEMGALNPRPVQHALAVHVRVHGVVEEAGQPEPVGYGHEMDEAHLVSVAFLAPLRATVGLGLGGGDGGDGGAGGREFPLV